ncbi:CcoQ/FixQ family Cbb3-type cytochrome c oxidase assembly chaperone [Chitinophaga sp. 22620]|uniref:CcoQ/FixQ family Cbb3-type cytochrome c oxidase assembly chaperone n=1 Tax=Chitinophaga sp. 22620 TaxID=3453952 RepID=UPI003F86DD16
MKFINYLKSIDDVSIYPMVSLIIFSAFFLLAAWWAFKADRKMMEHISGLPLDDNDSLKNQ